MADPDVTALIAFVRAAQGQVTNRMSLQLADALERLEREREEIRAHSFYSMRDREFVQRLLESEPSDRSGPNDKSEP